MDSMFVNKAVASGLLAGIAFMLCTMIASGLVQPVALSQGMFKIQAAPTTPEPAPTAASAKPELIGPLLATADPSAGQGLTKKLCIACHSFTEGGKAGVGPNLYGVVGTPHGHMPGFSYSTALKGKDGPWTFDALNAWLTNPSAYAPGTKMAFAGLANTRQRADVISYLRSLSPEPAALPAQ